MNELYNLNYDDVFWIPKFSVLESRDLADVSVNFLGRKWNLPVIPANMQTTISFEKAEWLADHNFFYILHRFYSLEDIKKWIEKNQSRYISISVGVSDKYKDFLKELYESDNHRIDCITIDIAHGYSIVMEKMLVFLEKLYGNGNRPKIIAGNFAGDHDSIKFIESFKIVDAIKIGLASGRACRTYHSTGIVTPMVKAGISASEFSKLPLIGDGGVRMLGDIVKGLISGYTMIMIGSLFAACVDSPAETFNGKKVYYGSASFIQKKKDGEDLKYIEGDVEYLQPSGMSYEDLLRAITESLKSAVSYAGGRDLSCFSTIPLRMFYSRSSR